YHTNALNKIDTENDLLYLGLLLPNAFSRSHFMRFLLPDDMNDDNDAVSDCKDNLLFLINVTFPIFERAFFISLVDYARGINSDNPLVYVKQQLEEYVNRNYMTLTKNGYFANSIESKTSFSLMSWEPLSI